MLNFDTASTTQISKEALSAYISASEFFHNPSALYSLSLNSQKIIENARSQMLKHFNGKRGSTIIFTGGATESNNSVLNSCINRLDKKYLIGGGEHSSIYVAAKAKKDLGYQVEFIPLKSNGGIDIEALKNMLDESVSFVSVMHVSNETGAINDIKQISQIVKSYNNKILIHSDGVQAVGKINIDLNDLNVDFYTMSAHKINGPKGVGCLYIASPNKYKSFVLGGEQEMGLRAGTENVPGIASFLTAIENTNLKDFSEHKKAFINNIYGDFKLVSDNDCVDNIISLCFAGVRGETILHMLETKGYLIGTGSACNSKAKVNRVLFNIVPNKYLSGAVRVSFDDTVTIQDITNLAIEMSNAVKEYIQKTK